MNSCHKGMHKQTLPHLGDRGSLTTVFKIVDQQIFLFFFLIFLFI